MYAAAGAAAIKDVPVANESQASGIVFCVYVVCSYLELSVSVCPWMATTLEWK